jgi:tetratricopeptide (TPR) repeat protein
VPERGRAREAPRAAGPRAEVASARRPPAPQLPDDIDAADLDRDIQRELAALPTGLAELIGKHLMAAAGLLDDEPAQALEHARFARTRAARVPVVREAAGVAAYHAGEWAEALSELRTARRLGGGPGLLAMMADCERALGRPDRALDLARSSEARQLEPADAVELKIVAAGARRDLGQPEAAVVALQGPDLDLARRDPWSARLFYAYADNLAAAGRQDDAARWFVAAADADEDGETDAAQRVVELGSS